MALSFGHFLGGPMDKTLQDISSFKAKRPTTRYSFLLNFLE